MGWEDTLKSLTSPNIKEILKRFHPHYEELIAHPDFKIDSRQLAAPEKNFIKDITEGKINLLDFNDEHLNDDEKADILQRISNIRSILRTLKKEAVVKRSVDFLISNAEAFGVKLLYSPRYILDTGVAQFKHRGLDFYLNEGGVTITIPGTEAGISICVVDEKKLPMGDFYASMLGLIVAKPEELDVVDFGIKLGLIILNYSDYDWKQATSNGYISIYTPFDYSNRIQNRRFINLLGYIKTDDYELAPDILKEIEAALEDCFGSTRGFF